MRFAPLPLLCCIMPLLLCCAAASVAQPAIAGGDRVVVAESGLPFGADLLKGLAKAEPGKNILISPFSISSALGMTLNGVRGAGAEAMIRGLHMTGLTPAGISSAFGSLGTELARADSGVTMESGNSIWYARRFAVSDSFRASMSGPYGAEIRSVDFTSMGAVKAINEWVSQRTRGKIPVLLSDPPGGDMMMMLINAIYFKGSWARKFDKKLTREENFTTGSGARVRCRMMHRHDTYEYFDDGLVQGVDIPYGDGRFMMTVLLPRTDVDAIIPRMTPEVWSGWRRSMRPAEMELGLPKFKIEYEVPLLGQLKKLGVIVPGLDLSGLGSGGKDLAISSVIHKTFIEVNEEGTEAAAVTSVGAQATSVGPKRARPISFVVDRPALFLIRERETGAVMFIGKLAVPR